MERKHFIALLYLCGIVPLMYALSTYLNTDSPWFSFGILNIVTLIVWTLIFTPNNNPTTAKKKKMVFLTLGSVIGTLLLIAGAMKVMNSGSERLYDNVIAPAPSTGIIQNISGTLVTGDTQSGEIVAIDLITGDITVDSITGTDDNAKPSYPATTNTGDSKLSTDTFAKKEATTTVSLPEKGSLTYSQVIPYLVDTYNLSTTKQSTKFSLVGSTNPLYESFAIAAAKGMIGSNVNPSNKVSCNTYMVLKGIAAGWKVSYKAGDPFSAYRTAAYNRGEVNGCLAGNFVTKATL